MKIYKTRRKLDLYLYVDFKEDLSRVPDELLARFGRPELALSLKLSSTRPLARAEAAEVLAQIESTGYYLQVPPNDGGVEAVIRASRQEKG